MSITMRAFGWLIPTIILLSFTITGTSPKKIVERLAIYNREMPQEKVYLHLDKPQYNPGDTIWLKAYLVHAQSLMPDSISRVLYLDFIDKEKGRIIAHKMLRTENGISQGALILPDTLRVGVYNIRSYTNWMKNFPQSLFFSKDVWIKRGNADGIEKQKLLSLSAVADIQFFPEGGDMIFGLPVKVGFKAVNSNGKGIDAHGFILNSKKDTVVTFRSSHLGIGSFKFGPVIGEKYSLYVTDVNGIIKPYPLPDPREKGFTISVDNLTMAEEIRVQLSQNFKVDKNVMLIAHQRGQVRYAADIKALRGSLIVRVPKANFRDDGIIHFTLFDEEGLPQCERLVFHLTGKSAKAEITTDKILYKTREKVNLDIVIKDNVGKPVQGNFSLAVTDAGQVIQDPYEENISTYLLLSSDVGGRNSELRGHIEQPHYYFDERNINAGIHLDNLLLTQGWRRFNWDEVINRIQYRNNHLPEPGLIVSGHVNQHNGKPFDEPVNQVFTITSGDGSSQIVQGFTDPSGKFYFNDLDFFGPATITAIQPKAGKRLDFTFDSLMNKPMTEIQANPGTPTDMLEDAGIENFLLSRQPVSGSESKTLQEVVIVGSKTEHVDSRKLLLSTGKSADKITVELAQCGNITNAFLLLQSKASGVRLIKTAAGYQARIRAESSFLQSSEPMYLLDGIPVDGMMINSLPPCSVETVEVFKTINTYGMRGVNGAIAFFSRKDYLPEKGASTTRMSRISRMAHPGFEYPRQFYSPKYDHTPDAKTPDFRSTLYWNPAITTDSDGKASLSFWNSDAVTDIRANLQGISFRGQTVAATTTYSIQ